MMKASSVNSLVKTFDFCKLLSNLAKRLALVAEGNLISSSIMAKIPIGLARSVSRHSLDFVTGSSFKATGMFSAKYSSLSQQKTNWLK